MRISTGVEDDAVVVETDFVDPVDQFSLDVTLKISDLAGRVCRAKLFEKSFKCRTPVDIGLPFAQQIEIGTIDNKKPLHIPKFNYLCDTIVETRCKGKQII